MPSSVSSSPNSHLYETILPSESYEFFADISISLPKNQFLGLLFEKSEEMYQLILYLIDHYFVYRYLHILIEILKEK